MTQQGVTTRKTMTGFLIVYSLTSDGRYTGDFLSNYAYINIQNELLKIDGVGKVDIMGAGEYAMRIWLKPDLLDYYKISLDEVFAAVEAQGGIFPAGKFGGEPAAGDVAYTYTVTMPPQIYDAEQFGDIIISTTPEGEQVRLSDIADVALGSRQYGVESLFNSDPTALIVIYQQPGSNAVDVGNSVKAEMERLSKRFPDGITYTSMVDATTSIEAGVKDIFVTLIIALILVIAIIFLSCRTGVRRSSPCWRFPCRSSALSRSSRCSDSRSISSRCWVWCWPSAWWSMMRSWWSRPCRSISRRA